MANPVGRPTDYRPEYCQMLIDHMSQGLSFESFAGVIDVCKETLYTWFRQHPEFLDARSRAIEKSRLWWEKTGNAGMLGQEIEINGKRQKLNINASIWMFNMKNRFKWADRQVVEGDTDSPAIKLSYSLKDDDK